MLETITNEISQINVRHQTTASAGNSVENTEQDMMKETSNNINVKFHQGTPFSTTKSRIKKNLWKESEGKIYQAWPLLEDPHNNSSTWKTSTKHWNKVRITGPWVKGTLTNLGQSCSRGMITWGSPKLRHW